MKMFVVDVVNMAEDKVRVKKGLGLTYGTSGRKKGFKNFWMGCIENENFFEYGIYLSKDIQETLPEFPESFSDISEIKKAIRINNLSFMKHPTIPDKWMAVHNEVNKAMIFFSKDDFNIVFPITKPIEIVEKDCPHNHRLSYNYGNGNECKVCGAKGVIRPSDDKIFFKLAEKNGIEIGNGKRVIEDFLHTNDGKINVFTTGCYSGYDLSTTAETKYNGYPSFELNPDKKILIGATIGDTLYILKLSFDGTEVKLNVEKEIEHVIFDFTYAMEVSVARDSLKQLIESRKSSDVMVVETKQEVEDSPFAVLKNLKLDN